MGKQSQIKKARRQIKSMSDTDFGKFVQAAEKDAATAAMTRRLLQPIVKASMRDEPQPVVPSKT